MDGIFTRIPGEQPTPASADGRRLEMELARRHVAAMYADKLVGGSSSCILSRLEKSEMCVWLNDGHRVRPLSHLHYELERRNLAECLNERA